MNQERVVEFKDATSDFELLDLIRIRYQMFANNIQSLRGILTGYGLARDDYEQIICGFSEYLTDLKKVNPFAVSWDMIISNEAGNTEYEIPLFYKYLDEYRNINHEPLGEIELSWEQRNFYFRRCIEKISVDNPELPLKAPHRLIAVKIPGVKVHAFYYDEGGNKYYEQCLMDFARLKKWVSNCFNINQEQW